MGTGVKTMASKLTKKEQWAQMCRSIVTAEKSLTDIKAEYENLLATQTIYKRAPKKNYRALWAVIIQKRTEKYIACNDIPISQLEYITKAYIGVWSIRNAWNERCLTPYFYETEVYNFLNNIRPILISAYKKAHPEMIKADALLEAILKLHKGGVSFPQLDEEFKAITKLDPNIVLHLPTIERVASQRLFEKGDYSFDPYGVYFNLQY